MSDDGTCSVVTRAPDGALTTHATFQLSGELRAQYRLGTVLGSGAMGVVYEALQLSTGRTVAAKFLIRSEDPVALARFLREGRLLARLSHPHVLHIFDAGEEQGHPFLVTELLPGGSLQERLRETPALPLTDALRIARECFAGLSACHEAGILHRDLKPANVMFSESGAAKVADLGIARCFEFHDRLTSTGALIGTPRYMAPEQLEAEETGAAADLYAMGLILFELVTGRFPFDAHDLAAVFNAHLHLEPPPVRSLAPAVPAEVGDLVARCLAKKPSARPASALECERVLAAALDPPASRPRSGRVDRSPRAARDPPARRPGRVRVAGAPRAPRPRPIVARAAPVAPEAPRRSRGWVAFAVALAVAAGMLELRRPPRPPPPPQASQQDAPDPATEADRRDAALLADALRRFDPGPALRKLAATTTTLTRQMRLADGVYERYIGPRVGTQSHMRAGGNLIGDAALKALKEFPFWPRLEAFRARTASFFSSERIPDEEKLRLYDELLKLVPFDLLIVGQPGARTLGLRELCDPLVQRRYRILVRGTNRLEAQARRVSLLKSPAIWRQTAPAGTFELRSEAGRIEGDRLVLEVPPLSAGSPETSARFVTLAARISGLDPSTSIEVTLRSREHSDRLRLVLTHAGSPDWIQADQDDGALVESRARWSRDDPYVNPVLRERWGRARWSLDDPCWNPAVLLEDRSQRDLEVSVPARLIPRDPVEVTIGCRRPGSPATEQLAVCLLEIGLKVGDGGAAGAETVAPASPAPPPVARGASPAAQQLGRLGAVNMTHAGAQMIQFSRNGRFLISGDQRTTVRIWDARTGAFVRRLPPASGGAKETVAEPSDTVIALPDGAGRVALWEAGSGLRRGTVPLDALGANCVASQTLLSPDGATLAVVTGEPLQKSDELPRVAIALLDARGQLRHRLRMPLSMHPLSFSPDSRYLAAQDVKTGIWVWEVASGRLVPELRGVGFAHRPLAFHPDGKQLLAQDQSGAWWWWELSGAGKRPWPREPGFSIDALCIAPDGRSVATGGDRTGHLVLRSAFTGQVERALTPSKDRYEALAFDASGSALAALEKYGRLEVRSFPSGELRCGGSGPAGGIRSVSLSGDGSMAIIHAGNDPSREDAVVSAWDTRQRARLAELAARDFDRSVFVPGTDLLVLGGISMVQARIENGAFAQRSAPVRDGQLGVDLLPGAPGQYLEVERERWRVHDARTGRTISSSAAPAHSHLVGARVARGGLEVASAMVSDRTTSTRILFHDAASGALRADLTVPEAVSTALFSSDLKQVALVDREDALHVRELPSGRRVLHQPGPFSWAARLCFVPGDRHLAMGGEDGSIRWLDLATGQFLPPVAGHSDAVTALCFSADGRRMLSGSSDGAAILWEILWK